MSNARKILARSISGLLFLAIFQVLTLTSYRYHVLPKSQGLGEGGYYDDENGTSITVISTNADDLAAAANSHLTFQIHHTISRLLLFRIIHPK